MARILVIENNPFFADVLACTLALEKHDVAVANAATEGIRLGLASHPDLVVAAWSLRGDVHGGEVCRRIRAASPGTKAVIITGHSELVSQAREYCRSAVAVLVKPFHRADILAAVRRALRGGAVIPPIHLVAADSPDVAANTILISR
jgi:two-component system, OmpR family, response regulator